MWQNLFNTVVTTTVYMLGASSVRFNGDSQAVSSIGGMLTVWTSFSMINVADAVTSTAISAEVPINATTMHSAEFIPEKSYPLESRAKFLVTATGNLSFKQLYNVPVDSNPSDVPVVAGLSTGNFVVGWRIESRIYAQIYTNIGVKIGEIFMVTNLTNNYLIPIVGLSNGNFVVAWRGAYIDVYSEAYAQIYTDVGVKVGSSFMMNSTSDIAIANLSNGNFVITWAKLKVYSQIHTNTGVPVGMPLIIDTLTFDTPQVVSFINGNFIVYWRKRDQTSSGNSVGVYGQTYNVTGIKIGGEFQITADPMAHVSITALSNNNCVVIWDSLMKDQYQVTIYGLNLYGQIYSSIGRPIGTTFLVTPVAATVGGMLTYDYNGIPVVTDSSNKDNFVVVWNRGYTENNGRTVRIIGGLLGQVFNYTGTKIGSFFSVGSSRVSAYKDITNLINGNFVLVESVDYAGLFAKIFTINNETDPSTSPSPSSAVVSPSPSTSAVSPSSAMISPSTTTGLSPSPSSSGLSLSSASTNKPLLVNFIASGISLMNLAKNSANSWWYGENNLNDRVTCLENLNEQQARSLGKNKPRCVA